MESKSTILTVVILLLHQNVLCEEEIIDPFDMLHYSHASKSMRKPVKLSGTDLILQKVPEEQAILSSKIAPVSLNGEKETAFIQRFIKILLNVAGLSDESKLEGVHYTSYIGLKIDAIKLKMLNDYASNSNSGLSLNDIDEILTKALFPQPKEEYSFWKNSMNYLIRMLENLDFDEMIVIAVASLPVYLYFTGMGVLKLIVVSMLGAFGVTYVTTHKYMIKVKEIEKVVTQQKFPDIPRHCKPSSLGFFEYLTYSINSVFVQKDKECQKYYEAFALDASLEVTPFNVIMHIFSTALSQPLDVLSGQFIKLNKAIFGELPFLFSLPVFVVTMLALFGIAIVLIILVFGRSFNIGGWFGLNVRQYRSEKTEQAIKIDSSSTTPAIQQVKLVNPDGSLVNEHRQVVQHIYHIYQQPGETRKVSIKYSSSEQIIGSISEEGSEDVITFPLEDGGGDSSVISNEKSSVVKPKNIDASGDYKSLPFLASVPSVEE